MEFDLQHMLIWAFSAGMMWLGKEIIKPWSDAALMRARAFTTYVENQGKGQDILVTESKRQTDLLVSLDLKTTRQNSTLDEMNTSSKAICRADQNGCRAGEIATMLGTKMDMAIDRLESHMKKIENKAASDLLEGAATTAADKIIAAAEAAKSALPHG